MFKPHYDICHGCANRRLIITKRGFCEKCDPKQQEKRNNRISRERGMGAGKRVPGMAGGTGRLSERGDNEKNNDKGRGSGNVSGFYGHVHKANPSSKTQYTKTTCSRRKSDTARSDKKLPCERPVFQRKRLPKKNRKPTGELALYAKLYEERGPYSQVSGQWVAFAPIIFSHILSKGAYPAFRLYEKNIVIKTIEEHHQWETQRHKLKDKPEWQWIFTLEQELKIEYYEKIKIR